MNKLYFLIVVFFTAIIVNGQIGINTNLPNSNSLLHIASSEEHLKGILIPKLTQDELNKLTYSDYPTNTIIRLTEADHGLKLFNIDDACEMYWSTYENKWLSQCGNEGNAKFTYSCSSLAVYGNYVKGRSTDLNHYLLLNVDVQKKGNYKIVADPIVENGFSFEIQGYFNTRGPQTIKIPAQGIPIVSSSQPNVFKILTSQGSPSPSVSSCTFNIDVVDKIADYSLNCSSATVLGKFLTGIPLTNLNKIILTVTATSLGSYDIFTEEVNGIVFKSRGIFTTLGRQEISLIGEGRPLVYDNFDVTLIANSLSSAIRCKVNIPLILPEMTIGLIGKINQPINQMTDWTTEEINPRYRALTNLNNFSENGLVKITNLNIIQFGSLGIQQNLLDELTTMLGNERKPDVLIYNSSLIPLNPQISSKLAEYVNKGGVLLFGSQNSSIENSSLENTRDLIVKIFGDGYNIQRQIEGEVGNANTYPIKLDISDPIINGVFGDASGQYWGEEGESESSLIFPTLPPKSVQIASAYNSIGKSNVDINKSIVWYNKEKGFVFFGDSTRSVTGIIGTTPSYSSSPSYYLLETVNGVLPKSKSYGPGTVNNRLVFNSILEMNAVAWALKKAANEGINTH